MDFISFVLLGLRCSSKDLRQAVDLRKSLRRSHPCDLNIYFESGHLFVYILRVRATHVSVVLVDHSQGGKKHK